MNPNTSEESVWCLPCKSFHPVPRDVAHWIALRCFADPPKPAKPKVTDICTHCGLPHVCPNADHVGHCFRAKSKAMADLLKNVGESAKCRGCQAEIFWVTHRNGKKTPYTPAGLNHHIDCPAAKQFDKKLRCL